MVSKKKSKVAKKKPVKKSVKKSVKKRAIPPKIIKCKHYTGDGYFYDINGQNLAICDVCNMFLAGEIMKQMATETFIHTEQFLWKGLEDMNERLEALEKKSGKK